MTEQKVLFFDVVFDCFLATAKFLKKLLIEGMYESAADCLLKACGRVCGGPLGSVSEQVASVVIHSAHTRDAHCADARVVALEECWVGYPNF